jgi:hypothetical protein
MLKAGNDVQNLVARLLLYELRRDNHKTLRSGQACRLCRLRHYYCQSFGDDAAFIVLRRDRYHRDSVG